MRLALTSALLFALWLALSGSTAPLYVTIGIVVSIAAAFGMPRHEDATRFRPLAFLWFVPWLVWQVIRSNVRISRMVLSVRLPIRPSFIVQPPGVHGTRALTALATAVTLTPGTLTVDVTADELFVHSLDAQSAIAVKDGSMARQVGRVFRPSS